MGRRPLYVPVGSGPIGSEVPRGEAGGDKPLHTAGLLTMVDLAGPAEWERAPGAGTRQARWGAVAEGRLGPGAVVLAPEASLDSWEVGTVFVFLASAW